MSLATEPIDEAVTYAFSETFPGLAKLIQRGKFSSSEYREELLKAGLAPFPIFVILAPCRSDIHFVGMNARGAIVLCNHNKTLRVANNLHKTACLLGADFDVSCTNFILSLIQLGTTHYAFDSFVEYSFNPSFTEINKLPHNKTLSQHFANRLPSAGDVNSMFNLASLKDRSSRNLLAFCGLGASEFSKTAWRHMKKRQLRAGVSFWNEPTFPINALIDREAVGDDKLTTITKSVVDILQNYRGFPPNYRFMALSNNIIGLSLSNGGISSNSGEPVDLLDSGFFNNNTKDNVIPLVEIKLSPDNFLSITPFSDFMSLKAYSKVFLPNSETDTLRLNQIKLNLSELEMCFVTNSSLACFVEACLSYLKLQYRKLRQAETAFPINPSSRIEMDLLASWILVSDSLAENPYLSLDQKNSLFAFSNRESQELIFKMVAPTNSFQIILLKKLHKFIQDINKIYQKYLSHEQGASLQNIKTQFHDLLKHYPHDID